MRNTRITSDDADKLATPVAATAAQRRSDELAVACRYVVTEVLKLAEYSEPFWWPQDVDAAAWRGKLPSSFALVARRTRR